MFRRVSQFNFLITVVLLCLPMAKAHSRVLESNDFMAARTLGHDIASWITKVPNSPESVLIYSVNSHEPYDKSFSDVLETEIMDKLGELNIKEVTTCHECRIAQVRVDQSQIIVSKGAPDTETIKRMASKYPTKSAVLVEVYKTKVFIQAQAVLYTNPGGRLIGAEKFKVPILDTEEKAVQFLLTFGSGFVTLDSGTSSGSGLRGAGNITLLEEIGFAKAGLNLGGVFTPGATLFHLNPTLGIRNRFGASKLKWGLDIGLGYGLAGSRQGFVIRAAPQLFFGSFAVVGGEFTYFLANDGGTGSGAIQTYYGLHIGFTLGG